MLLISDHDSKSAGVFHCCKHYWRHFVMGFVKIKQFLKWVLTKDVTVKYEENFRSSVGFDDFLSESEGTRCAESFLFFGVSDFDFIFLSEELKISLDDFGLVIDGKDDLVDSNFR